MNSQEFQIVYESVNETWFKIEGFVYVSRTGKVPQYIIDALDFYKESGVTFKMAKTGTCYVMDKNFENHRFSNHNPNPHRMTMIPLILH